MATLVAELHRVIRANTPDEREHKRYTDEIKNFVLAASYTPPKVANAIAEAIWNMRIVPKRIPDPSAGTRVFVSVVDFHVPYAEITRFEKDSVTGLILRHPHPEKWVRVQGFEHIEPKYASYYDVTVSNTPFGDVVLLDPFFSAHTDPVRWQSTRMLYNYFFMKSIDMVHESGLMAFITSQGVLNAKQGRPVCEWLMNRYEPVPVIQLPNNLSTKHAGTEVGSDLAILQKKAAIGKLSERQRDFIKSCKLSNGIRIDNLFQSFDRVTHIKVKVGKDPYGKPAMEFTHVEDVDGVDREMRRMLSEDFNRHFNESYCLEHAPEQTPGTLERGLSRPRQAERQRAERHEPRLAGEIIKEIIVDARNLQQQQKEEGKRRVVVEMAAQSCHVDTEAGKITRIENKPGQVLPDSAAIPAEKPIGEGLADFGARLRERENRLWEQHPSKSKNFGMANAPVQHVGGIAEPKPREGFAGSLFDTVGTAAPVPATQTVGPVNVQQGPLLTLYDLFGLSAEERRRAEFGTSKKRNSRREAKRKTPRQPSLFASTSSSKKQKSKIPETTPPERGPEDLYASPNWEDNPPINGFYEMMMSPIPERRAELCRQSVRQQETPEQRERQAVHPLTEAPKGERKQTASTLRTGGLFDMPDNPEEEEPGKEMPQVREADMKPRPFEGEVAPCFCEGILVTDGQNRVGYLRGTESS